MRARAYGATGAEARTARVASHASAIASGGAYPAIIARTIAQNAHRAPNARRRKRISSSSGMLGVDAASPRGAWRGSAPNRMQRWPHSSAIASSEAKDGSGGDQRATSARTRHARSDTRQLVAASARSGSRLNVHVGAAKSIIPGAPPSPSASPPCQRSPGDSRSGSSRSTGGASSAESQISHASAPVSRASAACTPAQLAAARRTAPRSHIGGGASSPSQRRSRRALTGASRRRARARTARRTRPPGPMVGTRGSRARVRPCPCARAAPDPRRSARAHPQARRDRARAR